MTDWKAYFRKLYKKLWVFALILILFVSAASYVALFFIKPKYEASIQIYVLIYQGDRLTYDNMMASQALVKDYKELIKSRSVTSAVINKLNLGTVLTDQTLTQNIDVELIPNSSMLKIIVLNEDPAIVADIANELGSVFIQNMMELTKTSNISLVDKAVVSEKPVSPRSSLIIICSILLATILYMGLVFVFVYFDDSIGSLEEIEKKTGIHVVGIIPDTKMR